MSVPSDPRLARAQVAFIQAEVRHALQLFTNNLGQIDFTKGNGFSGTLAYPNGGSGTNTGAEPALGNPAANGYVLSSTTAGVRSWVAQASGSGLPWVNRTKGVSTPTGNQLFRPVRCNPLGLSGQLC